MQENFDSLLEQLGQIHFNVIANKNLVAERLSNISNIAKTQLDGFKDSAVVAKCDEYTQKQEALTKEVENCDQKLAEFQKIKVDAPGYSHKLEELIGHYQLINLNVTDFLKELDQLEREVSELAEKRVQEKKANYETAVRALQNEIDIVRSVNEPIDTYIQQIETAIINLEKNAGDTSLLTVPKQILQPSRQTIQQAGNNIDSADSKIQALTSNPPTSATIVKATTSISGMTAKLKQASEQLAKIDYSQLSIAENFVNLLKNTAELANKIKSIESRVSTNLDQLDIATAKDEAALNLGRENIRAKVELEKEKKELTVLHKEIDQLNQDMSSADLQNSIVAQKIYDSINIITKRIEEINNNLNLMIEKVENISKKVRERNIAPINALKQRLEQIILKRDESQKAGFSEHEKEINEKIKDFTDQYQALEANFDKLIRSEQKSEIKKLETLVLQLESYIYSRYQDMAGFYQAYEEGTKKLEEEISKNQEKITNIRDKRKACKTRLGEVNREIANNTANGISIEKAETRILALEKELSFGKADKADKLIFAAKADRLDSKVQKLRNEAKQFVLELNNFIQAIERELQEGALGQQASMTAQKVFRVLAGQQIADEMGDEWGINQENERREKINNILIEVIGIRDELEALHIDESYTGQLSKEAYEKIETLANKLNERASKLNRLINAAQEGASQVETKLRMLLGQTSIKKEASGFNKFLQVLCLRVTKLLKRLQLHSDYRDWHTLHDAEPDRLISRELLLEEQLKLVAEKIELHAALVEANKNDKQLFAQQAERQNPLRNVEWPLTYQNEEGNTLLHGAVAENNIEMLLLFLQQTGHESFDSDVLNIKNNQGKAPVDLAFDSKNDSIINLLVKDNYRIDYNRWRSIINSKDLQLITQFAQTHDIEIYTRHIEFTKDRKFWMEVLRDSPDVKAGYLLNAKDKNGNTLLHAAVLSNDSEDAYWLISKGTDIKIRNKQEELSADLMKKENEKYSQQKQNEKNQSYVGGAISLVLTVGSILVGALLVTNPIGWVFAGVVGLVGLVGLVKNFIDAYNAPVPTPPFSAIPTTVNSSELLKVGAGLLAYLDKNEFVILARKPIENRWEIEVSPTTKTTISNIEKRKAIVANEIAPQVKNFEILELEFNEQKQNINKLMRFKEFLVRMKEIAPDMLTGLNYEDIDNVLGNQIDQINRLNPLMLEAGIAKNNIGQHLDGYDFSLLEQEFQRFQNLVDDNNLIVAVQQVEALQEQIKPIETEFAKLKDKVGATVMLDVNYFEKLKKDFTECKRKQESLKNLLVEAQDQDSDLMAKLNEINGEIRRAEKLIQLAEKNLDKAGKYLEGYVLSMFGEQIGIFQVRSERLGDLIQQIDAMQTGIEAKDLQLVPTLTHFAKLKNAFAKCESIQEVHKEFLSKNVDSALINEAAKVTAQIEAVKQLILAAEKSKNEASIDPESFSNLFGRQNMKAVNTRLENVVQQLVEMQEAIGVKIAQFEEEKSLKTSQKMEPPKVEVYQERTSSSYSQILSQFVSIEIQTAFEEQKTKVNQKIQEMKTEIEQKIQPIAKKDEPAPSQPASPQEEQISAVTHGRFSDFRALRQKTREAKMIEGQVQNSDKPPRH